MQAEKVEIYSSVSYSLKALVVTDTKYDDAKLSYEDWFGRLPFTIFEHYAFWLIYCRTRSSKNIHIQ